MKAINTVGIVIFMSFYMSYLILSYLAVTSGAME